MPRYNLKQQRPFKPGKHRVTPYPTVQPVLPNEDFKKPKDLTIKHLNFSYKPKKLRFPSDPDFVSYQKQIDPTDKKIIAIATAITGRKRLDEILDRPAHGLDAGGAKLPAGTLSPKEVEYEKALDKALADPLYTENEKLTIRQALAAFRNERGSTPSSSISSPQASQQDVDILLARGTRFAKEEYKKAIVVDSAKFGWDISTVTAVAHVEYAARLGNEFAKVFLEHIALDNKLSPEAKLQNINIELVSFNALPDKFFAYLRFTGMYPPASPDEKRNADIFQYVWNIIVPALTINTAARFRSKIAAVYTETGKILATLSPGDPWAPPGVGPKPPPPKPPGPPGPTPSLPAPTPSLPPPPILPGPVGPSGPKTPPGGPAPTPTGGPAPTPTLTQTPGFPTGYIYLTDDEEKRTVGTISTPNLMFQNVEYLMKNGFERKNPPTIKVQATGVDYSFTVQAALCALLLKSRQDLLNPVRRLTFDKRLVAPEVEEALRACVDINLLPNLASQFDQILLANSHRFIKLSLSYGYSASKVGTSGSFRAAPVGTPSRAFTLDDLLDAFTLDRVFQLGNDFNVNSLQRAIQNAVAYESANRGSPLSGILMLRPVSYGTPPEYSTYEAAYNSILTQLSFDGLNGAMVPDVANIQRVTKASSLDDIRALMFLMNSDKPWSNLATRQLYTHFSRVLSQFALAPPSEKEMKLFSVVIDNQTNFPYLAKQRGDYPGLWKPSGDIIVARVDELKNARSILLPNTINIPGDLKNLNKSDLSPQESNQWLSMPFGGNVFYVNGEGGQGAIADPKSLQVGTGRKTNGRKRGFGELDTSSLQFGSGPYSRSVRRMPARPKKTYDFASLVESGASKLFDNREAIASGLATGARGLAGAATLGSMVYLNEKRKQTQQEGNGMRTHLSRPRSRVRLDPRSIGRALGFGSEQLDTSAIKF